MASDLFHDNSPSKLREKIDKLVTDDLRSLPKNAKRFAAVAKLQEFDSWPGLQPASHVDDEIAKGGVELNRGLSGSNGVPAILYARDLVLGPMFPGTQSALGSGIYFSDLGCPVAGFQAIDGFRRISKTASEHGNLGDTGVILRCVLKSGSKLMPHQELTEYFTANRNRCREAQITDCGTLVAALGFDGIVCDYASHNHGEQWYVIVNRTALIFQRTIFNCPR